MLIQKIPLDANDEHVSLTTYILDESQELLSGKKRPAVLICPGGAYLNCSAREAEPIALRFAAMGYHAFVLRYHVFFDTPNGFERLLQGETFEPRKECQYPAAIRDIAHAMTVIYNHADEWFVDAEKIVLCGFSAGGHNVLNYAVHYDKPVITDTFEVKKIRPAAVIAGYPISDYLYMKESVRYQDDVAQSLFKLSNLAFFGQEEPSDEELAEVSAARLVSHSTPPTFIWATAGDKLVPVGHSTRMATALADAGVPFEIHIYEEGNHALALATQATATAKTDLNPIAAEWITSADIWLQKRFSLPLEEKGRWA
ncbi:alpha/beta hydrolase fold domain-containing protein [Streptococcus sp. zg-86]|uniref:Alpha/beta hydrolase fold domain-containing protein n=1 Tax=Streptococcus zhangguiae TaxID=2664091 RepID=A0A6I4RHF7_9STRE|nr:MULTISPECIES: alpha/beta hydrolase [unclassified Streptococcus]MTB63902.1 alpha/beta hydrolase fold domain-containing protein [Streptococcus sp. zg-86]MTB90213.1 alpha/beta hydrolase fold domain-containing protein [Streptococcus sp. zg-36]MWV55883.1 alpha/beta hydrolase fold domain-containing protein [Streptococcus sp. zg-70]QTH48684.1 alpha/beta hydrolase [Streptococcus sp. zg-86]